MFTNLIVKALASSVFFRGAEAQFGAAVNCDIIQSRGECLKYSECAWITVQDHEFGSFQVCQRGHAAEAKLGNPYDECVGCPPDYTYSDYNEDCGKYQPCKSHLVCQWQSDYGQKCKFPGSLLQEGEPCGRDAAKDTVTECESGLSCTWGYIPGGKGHTCTKSSGSGPSLGEAPESTECVGCEPDFAGLGDHCSDEIQCESHLICKFGEIAGGRDMRCQYESLLQEGEPCGSDAAKDTVTECESGLSCTWDYIPGGKGYTCTKSSSGSGASPLAMRLLQSLAANI